jgi:single-strand DNA-binding protein
MNINKVLLCGRVGEQPELKTVTPNVSVTSFSLATTQTYKTKDGEKREDTQWHKVVFWGRQAEVAANFLIKGSECFIEGRIETRKWEKDGQKHYTTEIIGERLQLGAKPQGNKQSADIPLVNLDEGEINPDDLPF